MAGKILPCFDVGRITDSHQVRVLPVDLRERVLAVIETGGSCRRSAERFGVAKASAIRRRARHRAESAVVTEPMRRDRHSHRTEVHAERILPAAENRQQVHLWEMPDASAEQGAAVSLSGLSRFLRRHS